MRGGARLPRSDAGRDMTDRERQGPRSSVFARLRSDSDEQWQPSIAPPWARRIGVALVLAIIALVIVATRLG